MNTYQYCLYHSLRSSESWGSQQLLVLEVKWLLAPGEMARSSLGWTDRPRMHFTYGYIMIYIYIRIDRFIIYGHTSYLYIDIYISFISYGVSEKWGQKPSFPTVWNCSFRSNKKNTMLGPLTGSRWVAKENQCTVPAATRPFSGTPSCNRRWTVGLWLQL